MSTTAELLTALAAQQAAYTTAITGKITEIRDSLDDKAAIAYVDSAIAAIVGMAPADLNTLQEIAAALDADGDTIVSLQTQINARALDADLTTAETNIASLTTSLGTTAGAVTTLNTAVTTLATNLAALETDVETITTTTIPTLATKAELTAVQADLQATINQMASDLDAAILLINAS